jgi:hypothetical protein
VLDGAHPRLDRAQRELVLAQAGGNPLLLLELAGPDASSPSLVRALQARLEDHPDIVRQALREQPVRIRLVAALGRGKAGEKACFDRRGAFHIGHLGFLFD